LLILAVVAVLLMAHTTSADVPCTDHANQMNVI